MAARKTPAKKATPKAAETPAQTPAGDDVPHITVPLKPRARAPRPDPRANRGAARTAGLGAKLAPAPASVATDPEPAAPESTTRAEEAALDASSAGEKASSTVPTKPKKDQEFARRVVSVPSVLSSAIAEACSRGGLRRQELVFEALNACHDRLAELVAEDNKPKMIKKGLFEVPAPRATSGGHLSINMRLTTTNSEALDTLVNESGAKGISQLVSVSLAEYLDVRI